MLVEYCGSIVGWLPRYVNMGYCSIRDKYPSLHLLVLLSHVFTVMVFWVVAASAQSEQRLASALDAATPSESCATALILI